MELYNGHTSDPLQSTNDCNACDWVYVHNSKYVTDSTIVIGTIGIRLVTSWMGYFCFLAMISKGVFTILYI